MSAKKTIYIAGPVTGVPNYWEAFEEAEDLVTGLGYTVLTPSRLPSDMTKAQYMRICFAMIDTADAVVFLGNWEQSQGARLERHYCDYTDKPIAVIVERHYSGEPLPMEVKRAVLECDLKEVLK